jgi:hypothetical protein
LYLLILDREVVEALSVTNEVNSWSHYDADVKSE